jgi:hypothetical protein
MLRAQSHGSYLAISPARYSRMRSLLAGAKLGPPVPIAMIGLPAVNCAYLVAHPALSQFLIEDAEECFRRLWPGRMTEPLANCVFVPGSRRWISDPAL